MSDEKKEKDAGKKINLNLSENVDNTDKIGSNEDKNKKEQVEKVAKSLVIFLLDMRKTLESARDIVQKIGFNHLALTLDTCVRDINIYLEQYKRDKKNEDEKKE